MCPSIDTCMQLLDPSSAIDHIGDRCWDQTSIDISHQQRTETDMQITSITHYLLVIEKRGPTKK